MRRIQKVLSLTWLGTLGGQESWAHAVSADGSVVVGGAQDADEVRCAFRWTQEDGMQDLNRTYADLLTGGSRLIEAHGISPDGRCIVGKGYNSVTGRSEGYLLVEKRDLAELRQELLQAGFEKGLAAYQRGDYATALKEWQPLAAGHPDAQFMLGRMYLVGRGVPQDYQEAAKWYRLAAEQGNVDAQLCLGRMYYEGRGVPQDKVVAYAIFTLNKFFFTLFAVGYYNRLAKKLTPREIEAGQALTKELAKPGNFGKALDAYLKEPLIKEPPRPMLPKLIAISLILLELLLIISHFV